MSKLGKSLLALLSFDHRNGPLSNEVFAEVGDVKTWQFKNHCSEAHVRSVYEQRGQIRFRV